MKKSQTPRIDITAEERAIIKGIADRMGVELDEILLVGGGEPSKILKARRVGGLFEFGPMGFENATFSVARITHGKHRGTLVLYDPDVAIRLDFHTSQRAEAQTWAEIGNWLYPCLMSSE